VCRTCGGIVAAEVGVASLEDKWHRHGVIEGWQGWSGVLEACRQGWFLRGTMDAGMVS